MFSRRLLMGAAPLLVAAVACSSDPEGLPADEGQPLGGESAAPDADAAPLPLRLAGLWRGSDGLLYEVEQAGGVVTGKLFQPENEGYERFGFRLERQGESLVGAAKWLRKGRPESQTRSVRWVIRGRAGGGLSGELERLEVREETGEVLSRSRDMVSFDIVQDDRRKLALKTERRIQPKAAEKRRAGPPKDTASVKRPGDGPKGTNRVLVIDLADGRSLRGRAYAYSAHLAVDNGKRFLWIPMSAVKKVSVDAAMEQELSRLGSLTAPKAEDEPIPKNTDLFLVDSQNPENDDPIASGLARLPKLFPEEPRVHVVKRFRGPDLRGPARLYNQHLAVRVAERWVWVPMSRVRKIETPPAGADLGRLSIPPPPDSSEPDFLFNPVPELPEPKPKAKPAPKPAPKPEPKPAPAPPKPAPPKPEPKPEPEPAPSSEKPAPEAPEPTPAKAAPKPAPKIEPEPKPAPPREDDGQAREPLPVEVERGEEPADLTRVQDFLREVFYALQERDREKLAALSLSRDDCEYLVGERLRDRFFEKIVVGRREGDLAALIKKAPKLADGQLESVESGPLEAVAKGTRSLAVSTEQVSVSTIRYRNASGQRRSLEIGLFMRVADRSWRLVRLRPIITKK